MKIIYSIVIALVLSTLIVNGATTPSTNVITTAKETIATNINQVMIEILSGVKNASGDIYKFSKQEIGQGYDFLKQQAPQVVAEFLKWKLVEAIIWTIIWVSLSCL